MVGKKYLNFSYTLKGSDLALTNQAKDVGLW